MAWMFERRGLLGVERGEDVDDDEIMLLSREAGAHDVVFEWYVIQILTEPSELIAINEELEGQGLNFIGA